MIQIDTLISHRFRGFSKQENTLDGLRGALDFGVKHIEFDIRVARCGTPMIYHDEHATDKNGKSHFIKDVMARDFKTLGGRFADMPSADALFAAINTHKHKDVRLWVDIKDAGFETEIHALICANTLQDRVIYVSWVAECLYAMHALTPKTPLCFSHWCQNPDTHTRTIHKVYKAKKGHVAYNPRKYVHGERSGWFVDGPVSGKLREILRKTKGAICVPANMVTADLVKNYQKDKIGVSTFSYTDMSVINHHKDAFNVDLYMIDNKTVFEAL